MDLEEVRVEVYNQFASYGTAPTASDLAAKLNVEIDAISTALIELANNRSLVLDHNQKIVMAHPFASIPLGFAVMGNNTLWWGGCSWDSFALPNLLKTTGTFLIATNCPSCEKALAWNVGTDSPPEGSEVAHFLVPVSQMWDDVVHTCANQRIFCSQNCLDSWLVDTGNSQGYVMNLDTLWKLASKWYEGRLSKGYVRRDPATAKEYFRACGLAGAFWGLD